MPAGLVPRLDRPSGNVTGFASIEASLGGKWLELLSEIAPGLKRAAIMFNPDTAPVSTFRPSFETAAAALKVVPIIAPVHGDLDIETAIIALSREPGAGLVVMPDVFTEVHRASIILAAARSNVPAVYYESPFARDGGLLSYGADRVDLFRRAASYVDRILRGAKPAELRRPRIIREMPAAVRTHHQLGFGSGGYTGASGTKPCRFGISTFGRLLASITSVSWMMPFR